MLPITHILYVGSGLFLAGLFVALGDTRRGPVARAAMGLGLCLMALAFARYWGAAQGQWIAVGVALLFYLRGLLPEVAEAVDPDEGGQP